ncbi:MAG: hypothetical protein GY722_10075 [bacterium]|nr:hypothetical protein [bacterium]
MKPFWTSRRSRERKALRASVRGRAPVSDQKFVSMADGRGDLAPRVAKALRSLIGDINGIPADRIYPRDDFWELFGKLSCRDWDSVEIILALEDELNIEIWDDDACDLADRTDSGTIGDWVCRIAEYLQEMLNNREA